MNKVYIDGELYGGTWIVKDLSEFYSIRYIQIDTNEEKTAILGWTKDTQRELELKNSEVDVRLYSVDLDGDIFEFVLRYEMSKFKLTSLNDKSNKFLFTGETLENENPDK